MEDSWLLERELNYGYLSELSPSQLADVLQDIKALLRYKIWLAKIKLRERDAQEFESLMKGIDLGGFDEKAS